MELNASVPDKLESGSPARRRMKLDGDGLNGFCTPLSSIPINASGEVAKTESSYSPLENSQGLNKEQEEVFLSLVLNDYGGHENFQNSSNNTSPGFPHEPKAEPSFVAKTEGIKIKKTPADKCKCEIPEFIKAELQKTSGRGTFTVNEEITLLYFAHQNILHKNSYSKIRQLMCEKRSRASIRRKIEKIVAKKTGVRGGLLQNDELRHETQKILHEQFVKVVNAAEKFACVSISTFASRMKQHAANQMDTSS